MTRKTALLVNVKSSWRRVLEGKLSPADSLLGDWGQLPDDTVVDDIEVVLGVCDDVIVGAFDVNTVEGWIRLPSEDNRVRFSGSPSTRFSDLVGMPNPGWLFSRRGAARSVQPMPLSVFTNNAAPVEEVATEDAAGLPASRAIVKGFILTVADEQATLLVPAGRSVTVLTN